MGKLKIAFARLNSDIHLRPESTVGQGVEHRRAFLYSLIEQGHNVTIVSPISNKDVSLLHSNLLFGNSWYNKLHYNINAVGDEFDVFILEAASQNAAFTRDIGDTEIHVVPFIFEKLKHYSGNVILWHHIYVTSSIVPFNVRYKYDNENLRPLDDINPNNWRVWFKDFDPYENKQWHLLYHCLDGDAFLDLKSRMSSTYRNSNLSGYHYLHLPQSKLDPYKNINPQPKYDAMWIGSRYSNATRYDVYDRIPNILKFYDTPNYRGCVIGNMESYELKRHNRLGDEVKFRYAETSVSKSNTDVAISLWNNSYTSIFTESKMALKLGAVTGRLFLALRGGSILLVDRSLSNVEKLGLNDYLVADAEEAKQKIDEIKQKTPSQRDEIRKQQLSTFPDWCDVDWGAFLSQPSSGVSYLS